MERELIGEACFFAASNSSHGFQNYYPVCFGEARGVERLYIIKGGPGTGKSYFMRTVGQAATARGYDVTHYYCSSDAASLDGIILQKVGAPCIGLLDGTAPHVHEPCLPGVREEIINLGAFWDAHALRAEAETIRTLGARKAEGYAMAYRYLAACGEMEAVIDAMIAPCVNVDKMTHLAERILKDQPPEKAPTVTPALLSSVGMTGYTTFDTFERLAAAHTQGAVVYLENHYGLGYRAMDAIKDLAQAKRLSCLVSFHPVHTHKVDGMFFPHTGLCVMVRSMNDGEEETDIRRIMLRRYVDAKALREVRGEVRRSEHLRNSLLEGAVRQLKQAAEHHFALEKIYSAAMDFEAKNQFEQAFCRSAFS